MGQVDRDRRGSGDRGLEGGGDALPAVGDHPVVEDQGRPRLPGLLLAADHQLAELGRAAPVDATQVVTLAVLAHRDVLSAAGREGPGTVVAGPGPGAAERDLGERHGPRRDGQRDRRTERATELDQTERVTDPHRHRPDLEAATHVGAHLVGHRVPPALADALEDEPRPGAEHVGHLVLEQQYAVGRHAVVGQRQRDPGGLSGRDQLRGHGADQGDPVAVAGDHHDGEHGQGQQQHADARQRRLVEQHRAHDRRDAGSDERPSANGQASQCFSHEPSLTTSASP